MGLKENLPALLKKKNWSYQKLAAVSKVPKSTIHGWVSGQTAVSLEQLKAVAMCLEVSVHSLAYGSPDPFEDKTSEVLEKLYIGDIRVTLHRIERKKK